MTLADLRTRLAQVRGSTGRGHLSPFFVLGDPSPALSVELARTAVAAGASMLELGIPYRDPCADGPAIQQACARAFAAGMTTDLALETLAAIAAACPGVPLNLLVYGNLVHARGLATFCRELAQAGASSLLVPDIPLGEDAALMAACERAELGFVRLVGPRTSAARLRASADGAVMLYAASVQGVTGAAHAVEDERARLLERAAQATERPLCAGFGIRSAHCVQHAFEHGAAVAVVGSQLAEVIAKALAGGDAALTNAIHLAVRALAPATSTTSPTTGI